MTDTVRQWVRKLMDEGRQVGVLHTDGEDMMEWYGDTWTLENFTYEQRTEPIVDWDVPHKDLVIVSAGLWTEEERQAHPGNPAFIQTLPGYWDWRIDAEFDFEAPKEDQE